MNVTVLADNTVTTGIPKGLRGEWGFAAAVGDVLFDTGQSSAAVENARILGVTTNPDDIVLSHTHYDHTAGLDKFLDPFNKPTVYCHPDLWSKRFIREPADGKMLQDPIHIGIPYSRAEVETGATIVEHRDPVGVMAGSHSVRSPGLTTITPSICARRTVHWWTIQSRWPDCGLVRWTTFPRVRTEDTPLLSLVVRAY